MREQAMTTEHDELLARLDKSNTWSSILDLSDRCRNAAAAIRDLSVKLEAERKAREAAEAALFFHHPFQIDGRTPGDGKKMNAVLEEDGVITGITSNGVYVGNISKPWDLTRQFSDRATAAEAKLASVFERTRERCAWEAHTHMLRHGSTERLAEKIRDAVLALAPEESAAPQVENPYLQMAVGNHSIGIVKDGKLIAVDKDVYVKPADLIPGLARAAEKWVSAHGFDKHRVAGFMRDEIERLKK